MAWVAAIIGVVGAIGGGAMAKDSADKAESNEKQLRLRELRLAERQDARSELLFDEYKQTYMPRERELVDTAFSDTESPEAAAARATTDVRVADRNMRETGLRDARRLGIDPSSGAYAAMENERGLRSVALEVSAKDQARQGARNVNFQRQHAAVSLGRNLPSTAGALTNSAMNGIGGLADAAARRTDAANEAVYRAGEQIGTAAGGLADAWRTRTKNSTNETNVAAA